MTTVKSLNKWANKHTYYPLYLLRMALGVFLFIKVIDFMSDPKFMAEVIKPFQGLPGGMIIVHYIVPAHFVGGFLIIIVKHHTFRTFECLVQIY